MGAYFLTLNRSKESVCIDLKHAAGRAVFLDLVRSADVVFDNFSVGVTARLGIDHAALAAVNPRIITCSVTGFGETGPDNKRTAFDQVVQGAGGGMSITGFPSSPPVRSGIPIGDLGGGVFGAMGVLAALQARERTGRGQHVDVSMLDAQISLLNYMATMHLMSGRIPERIGNAHFVHVPYNTYRTTDGWIIIACIGDAFFERFIQVVDRPGAAQARVPAAAGTLYRRPRPDRRHHGPSGQNTSRYWLDKLQEARIPCGPVNDFGQALSDPQVLSRNMVVEVLTAGGGSVRAPGNPIKFSESAGPAPGVPLRLGAHTHAVLAALGYDEERLRALAAAGAIA